MEDSRLQTRIIELREWSRLVCARELKRILGLGAYSIFCALFISLKPGSAWSAIAAGQMCDHAASVAASETGVPLDVLHSITRTETGRSKAGAIQPWPWTVNMEGVGKWFDSEDAARSYVFKHFKRGARSFDVGCFQINYRWHGEAFRSIDEMFDPVENARYAAIFLKRLFAETGDWSEAAGAYHSRTPKYATRYRARFDEIRTNVQDQPLTENPVVSATVLQPRENLFPLLQMGTSTSSRGSLVPLDHGSGRALVSIETPRGGI